MIKKVISLVVLATIFTVCLPIQETNANTTGANLKALETTLTLDEEKIIVANYATNTSLSVDEAEKQLTAELESKIKEDRSEQMNQTHTTRGASSGKYKLSKSKYVGDVFYTPSSTLEDTFSSPDTFTLIVESTLTVPVPEGAFFIVALMLFAHCGSVAYPACFILDRVVLPLP